jgi:predicted esterase
MRNTLSASLMLAALAIAHPLQAKVVHLTTRVADTVVHYQVVLPEPFDAQRSYPTILAFGGGAQTMDIVERAVERTFREQAEKRGYIVVIPAAPGGQLFFEEGARIFPDFLQQILSTYKVEGGKLLIAGQSNGGISAFYIAALYPSYFRSITAFPGFLPEPTAARVSAIAGMCIHMFVGQFDEFGFDRPMQQEAQVFRQQGLALTYSVEKGQPHRIATLAGAGASRLFDLFDQDRRGCTRS